MSLPSLARAADAQLSLAEPGPVPVGESGGFGLLWAKNERGELLPTIDVVSPEHAATQWVLVHVMGIGIDYSVRLGPYDTESTTFSVPIELDERAQAPGLVQVVARLEVLDSETEKVRATRGAPAAYVTDPASPAERWYDEASATAMAIERLGEAVPEGSEIDSIIGVEIAQ